MYQMSRGTRRVTLTLHVLSGVGWMGLDMGLAMLLVAARTTDDGQVAAAGYTAARLVVPTVVPVLAATMLVTGVLLGLGTRYGLVRWTWVLTKLVIGVLLTVLVFVLLVPGALSGPEGVTGSADEVRSAMGDAGRDLMFPPFVSFALLGVSLVLSVWKPWGRTRWGRRAVEGRADSGAARDRSAA